MYIEKIKSGNCNVIKEGFDLTCTSSGINYTQHLRKCAALGQRFDIQSYRSILSPLHSKEIHQDWIVQTFKNHIVFSQRDLVSDISKFKKTCIISTTILVI